MANLSASKKAMRVQSRKRKYNLRKLRAFKEARKVILDAIKAGDTETVQNNIPKFFKQVDKAAKGNNPLHKKTAARYKSRLMQKVNSFLDSQEK